MVGLADLAGWAFGLEVIFFAMGTGYMVSPVQHRSWWLASFFYAMAMIGLLAELMPVRILVRGFVYALLSFVAVVAILAAAGAVARYRRRLAKSGRSFAFPSKAMVRPLLALSFILILIPALAASEAPSAQPQSDTAANVILAVTAAFATAVTLWALWRRRKARR